jgi:hypothetical protein
VTRSIVEVDGLSAICAVSLIDAAAVVAGISGVALLWRVERTTL